MGTWVTLTVDKKRIDVNMDQVLYFTQHAEGTVTTLHFSKDEKTYVFESPDDIRNLLGHKMGRRLKGIFSMKHDPDRSGATIASNKTKQGA